MDIGAETGVEEQIPTGVMIVIVDIDLVAVPIPTVAKAHIVRSDDPVGTVVENDAARMNVEGMRDEGGPNVVVMAVGISMAGMNANGFEVVVNDDGVVMHHFGMMLDDDFLVFHDRFVLNLAVMAAIVMVLHDSFMLDYGFVLVVAMIAVMVVAIMGILRDGKAPRQSEKQHAGEELLHH